MSGARPLPSGGAALLMAWLQRLSQRQDLLIAGILILTVGMLVLPVPTVVVDFLIGCNMAVAVLLLMVAVYLRTPLDFSSLPGVILISTVFRLSLAVTTTRLILVQADAGHMVATFGEFVIAGNIVVGLVVFLIITIVQFIVVTKGAERVAEVGARFTLDALPGKQMSIDADLRSGDIDGTEARRRRKVVERESQFHGAMDGAMKFVKGDAIAGIVIIVINLVGGISIGTLQRGMPIGEAMHVYTLLTVGDALISQIPALFLSITAAIIVTRVGGEDVNLGRDIVGQLGADKRALRLAALVMLGMALVPGFPAPVFLLLAAAFGAASLDRPWVLPWRRKQGAAGREAPEAVHPPHLPAKAAESTAAAVEPVVACPIVVRLSPGLMALVGGRLAVPIQLAREGVAGDMGISCPAVGFEASDALTGHQYAIDLEGVPVHAGEARPGYLLLRDEPLHLDLLGVVPETGPPVIGNEPAHWVEASHAPRMAEAGIGFSDCPSVIGCCLRATLRRHAPGFLGIQETKALLARMERDYADLVREVSRVLPIQKIAEVLRRLLDEGIPIRNTRVIMEALAEWAERENRVVLLTEYVRSALARQICHRYANPQKVVTAYILEQDAESAVRAALRETAVGVYLALDAPTSDRIVQAVRACLAVLDPAQGSPVVVTSLDVRRYVRGLLVKNGLDLPVLSYQDLAPDFPVQPIGSIGLAEPASVELLQTA